jgi:hypothetical protein
MTAESAACSNTVIVIASESEAIQGNGKDWIASSLRASQ